jgi:proline iminopeptidase
MHAEGTHLEVGDGHRIWVRVWGNPAGVPVVFLHGGPGSGASPAMQGLFDPDRHRVVFVDQRGAGRSLPPRVRHANTTAHLVADLERVREALGFERWFVVGGSWGATLGLVYAEAHPGRVRGLALRSVFLGTQDELCWAFDTGLRAFFPARHAALHAFARGGDNPLSGIWQAILDPDPAVHRPAALAFYRAERAMSELRPPPDAPDPSEGAPLPATPFMEAHYFAHDCFLAPDQIVRDTGNLADIPAEIIQPLQDLLCPPAASARLVAGWPAARLLIVPGAGHSVHHPEVFAALREAIGRLLS